VSQGAVQARRAATAAAERKTAKYSSLSSSHVFVPVAVETLGPLADEAQLFLAEIGRRATLCMYVCPKIYIRRALNKITDAPRSQTNKNVFNARLKRSVDKSTERKEVPSPHRNHSRHRSTLC